MNLKILLKPVVFIAFLFLSACGPSVQFGNHYLEGPSSIQSQNYSVHYYHLDMGTEPACVDDEYDCAYRGTGPVDYHDVSQEIEAFSPSGRRLASEEILLIDQLSRSADLTFLFHPSEVGTYHINVRTRVYVRDQGLDNTEYATREILLRVESPSERPRLGSDVIYASALDLDHGLSPSSFEEIPNSEALLFDNVKLFADEAESSARFEKVGGYFTLIWNGVNYPTPFLSRNAKGYVALADPDGDGIEAVYFYYQPLNGFGERTEDIVYARLRFEGL